MMQCLSISTFRPTWITRTLTSSTECRRWLAGQQKDSSAPYKASVLLPDGSFPVRLEGDRRIATDKRHLEDPHFRSLYEWQKQHRADRPSFVLHDGPPYANGSLHLGHAVNKVLKDITNRWKIIRGHRVDYRPGWDCHGLPIELNVLRNSSGQLARTTDAMTIRESARKFALAAVEAQSAEFQSWGVMGDWHNPYLTLSPDYVKREMRFFGCLLGKGLIYRRYMPVYWSPWSGTALAESELEYEPAHKSTAVFVRMRLEDASGEALLPDTNTKGKRVYLLVWTTTPWTLAANRAVCCSAKAKYVLVEHKSDVYVVAADLLNSAEVKEIFGDAQVSSELCGQQLVGLRYHHPLSGAGGLPVLEGAHVTVEAGSGLVHTAPAHGPDDYLVGVKHGLDLSCAVDEKGCFTHDVAHAELRGLHVLERGTSKVIELLQKDGHVLRKSDFVHSYPYDWRSKKPVILRASKQWFMDSNRLQEEALSSLKSISIQPASASSGFSSLLRNRPYWCVSRQRVWGTPIPVFYDVATDEPVEVERLIERCCSAIDEHGTDFWWKLTDEEILSGTGIDPKSVVRGKDILDVWFDSGVSWSVLDDDAVADLYLEGLDQFSGWFYSSLISSTGIREKSPYKKLFVHGFTMDEEGRKMSKSLGNVIEPAQITTGHGAKASKKVVYGVDAMRMWVAAHASQSAAILVGDNILNQTKQEADRLRNTFKFLVGNINTTIKEGGDIDLDNQNLVPVDRYMLHCLAEFYQNVSNLYENMEYNKVCLRLQNFLASLSSVYFHAIKDRLYCDEVRSVSRRSAISTLAHVSSVLLDTVSPVMPILTSEVCAACPSLQDPFRVAHRPDPQRWLDPELDSASQLLLGAQKALSEQVGDQKLRQIQVVLVPLSPSMARAVELFQHPDHPRGLCELFQVPRFEVSGSIKDSAELSLIRTEDFTLQFGSSSNKQCPRCRLFTGKDSATSLCDRCEGVLQKVL